MSGGLEVASDRLLDLIQKGVTVGQVARVARAFTEAGIMVHAYLMYGFPTQTMQETIDSLEMVRQMFEAGIVQSGFWHRFAMTAHSPVGLAPGEYHVEEIGPEFKGFADNDRWHEDPSGADHDLFSEGLKKSLFNYMHGVCFDFPLSEWFDFETPAPTVHSRYIEFCLEESVEKNPVSHALVIWLGPEPFATIESTDEGEKAMVSFQFPQEEHVLETSVSMGQFLVDMMPDLTIGRHQPFTIAKLEVEMLNVGIVPTEFYNSSLWSELRNIGLLIL